MNVQNKKIEYKKLIPKGLQKTFNTLKEDFSSNSSKFNNLILLESRFNEIQDSKIKGIVDEKESNLEINKIRNSLLEFIDSINFNDLKKYDKNPPSSYERYKKYIETFRSETVLILTQLTEASEDDSVVFDSCEKLAVTYHSLSLFFLNNREKHKKIYLIDSKPVGNFDEDYTNLLQDKILNLYYDSNQNNSFDIIIIPGYIESKSILNMWAQFAHKLKVLLITDYKISDFDELKNEKISSNDIAYSNVIMTFNWIVSSIDSDKKLHLPPSLALGGLINSNRLYQSSSGFKYGNIQSAENVKFQLTQQQISKIDELGLISIIQAFGQVTAFSSRTLYSGPNMSLKYYNNVRVLDFLTKKIITLLDKHVNDQFSSKLVKGKIHHFLNECIRIKMFEQFKLMNVSFEDNDFDIDFRVTISHSVEEIFIKINKTQNEPEWGTSYSNGH